MKLKKRAYSGVSTFHSQIFHVRHALESWNTKFINSLKYGIDIIMFYEPCLKRKIGCKYESPLCFNLRSPCLTIPTERKAAEIPKATIRATSSTMLTGQGNRK